MANDCSWLSWLYRCRRRSQRTYIYLYSPTMTSSLSLPLLSSSSSSASHRCLLCILLVLCLALIVILAAASIYHLNSSDFTLSKPQLTKSCTESMTEKRQLPNFVNINIDPCENFYEFVCGGSGRPKRPGKFNDNREFEAKWRHVQNEIHEKIMTKISSLSIPNRSDHSSSIYRSYQLCENQSPILLLHELEHYFSNLSQKEPYRSYLTLFNQTNVTNVISPSTISLLPNPFFKIIPLSWNSSIINRVHHRPLPSVSSIFPNLTILNQTALDHLRTFHDDYHKLLSEENDLIKSYEQEYDQDSLIVRRILSFPDYHLCLSPLTLTSNTSNGLEKLIQLLNHFLHSRLHNFNRKSINKQIRILDKITDNHTLVKYLQRIKIDLQTIDQIFVLNNSNNSCTIDLLDKLLDQRIKSNELTSIINLYSPNQTTEGFISDDWPFLIMLYNRLLKQTSINTLVNYAFFDYYRQFIYPYYQPHIHHANNINISNNNQPYSYIYQANDSILSCRINSCFDVFNCYHPSLLNQLMSDHNQTFLNTTKKSVEDLINRFRLLTEQSDSLSITERKRILNELNQIQIYVGHYSPLYNLSLSNEQLSYLEYVQLLSSMPYDTQERSYYIEPIYYPLNHTLFLPLGFLALSNNSIEYHVIKLLLKILRLLIHSHPYHIECLLSSSDNQQDLINTNLFSNDEHIAYLLLRSKFIHEQELLHDEYLWPFKHANLLVKYFLIDYTAYNYCRNDNGYNLLLNNTYFIDDVHLIFYCKQASSIKQSKCTVV